MKKVTQWFPLTQPPARPGVYELRFMDQDVPRYKNWSRWDGNQWHLASMNKASAARSKVRSHSAYNGQFTGWRGLADKPEAA